MRPDNKLDAHIESSNFLINDGVYVVAEGAEIQLVANDLEFNDLFSTEYTNYMRWGASGVTAWADSTQQPIVRPFAESLYFKVEDSVRFTISDVDEFTCYYYDSIKVNTNNGIKPADVLIPNGKSDKKEWSIEGLESYEYVNIYVFNRWGGRVWQFSGSGLDYNANKWNGRNAKNKPLPSGTYYYVIQCSSNELGGKKKTGPVTIIR